MWSPPMVIVRSGFQEWSRNDAGAVAIRSVTMSGSKRTRAPSPVDVGAGRPQQLAGLGIEEVDADVAQDAQRREVDGLQLVLGDHLRGPQSHASADPRGAAPAGPGRAGPARRRDVGAPAAGVAPRDWSSSRSLTSPLSPPFRVLRATLDAAWLVPHSGTIPPTGPTRCAPGGPDMADRLHDDALDLEQDLDLRSLGDAELVAQMHDDLYDGLADEIHEGTTILLERGWSPQKVLDEALVEGMRIVGIDFRDGILFVPEVLLSANAMKAGMAILRPLLAETGAEPIGKVVIGTVKGDIHDIGKNLVAMMLEGAGFEVIDLGHQHRRRRVRRRAGRAQAGHPGHVGAPHHDDAVHEGRHRDPEGQGPARGVHRARRWRPAERGVRHRPSGPTPTAATPPSPPRRPRRWSRPAAPPERTTASVGASWWWPAARWSARCGPCWRSSRRSRSTSSTCRPTSTTGPSASPDAVCAVLDGAAAAGVRPAGRGLRRLRHGRPTRRRAGRAGRRPAGRRPLLRVPGRRPGVRRPCRTPSPAPSTSPTTWPGTSTRSSSAAWGSTVIPSCATSTSATIAGVVHLAQTDSAELARRRPACRRGPSRSGLRAPPHRPGPVPRPSWCGILEVA